MDWIYGAVFWLLLAFVGGVVGNAGWEFLKPRAQRVLDFIFKLLTLNRKFARDEIYQRAAKHQADSVSMAILTLVVSASSALLGVLTAIVSHPLLERLNIAPTERTDTPEWLTVTIVAVIFLIVYFIGRTFSTLQQIRGAVEHFRRACDILAPDLSRQELLELRRQFAAMKGEDDYKKLWSVIRAHQKRLSIEMPF